MARKALPDSAAPALPLAGGGGLPFDRERRLLLRGVWPVAGVDEVGRGPLAGPVVAAAVILNPDDVPAGLNDSKQLTRAARERLYDDIMARALHVAAASAPAEEIDATDIRRASLAAMARAVAALGAPPAFVFVDGRDRPALPCETEAVIGGDALVASIAAASIVAKVTRDRMMALLERVCPGYGFGRHMGYASAAHRAAIERLGPSRWHRFSFAPLRQRPDCAAELARRRAARA
ncbi:ribonuclease HII [Camelimonas abortus]|uniref:Ribonuclease HII n=1 Tax=Camelimonas abortus TaxID=1017184 RepID=A0ABV7LHI1_9HYPH